MDCEVIEVGRLADLIIVRETESGWPVVEHTLVGGATIYTSNTRVAAPVAVS